MNKKTEKQKQLNVRLPKHILKKMNLFVTENETSKENFLREIIEKTLEINKTNTTEKKDE